MTIPHIAKDEKGIPTLYVDDKPFFVTGGELHNSAGSSLSHLDESVWPNLRGMNVNAVIAPIYWELLEPEEGKYDFTLIDGMVEQARREGIRLIGLWFGLWKNAESMYVPKWMKKDTETYFHVQDVNGRSLNSISPQCRAAIDKDKAAYAQVMRHIREIDENQSTFIFMQVENEIGLLGTDRDYSDIATESYMRGVPQDLCDALHVEGTWEEAFCRERAAESFMAYHYAKAVEQITVAGMREHPIPAYTNSWLLQYPWYPGSYPSGGPVGTVRGIWKAMAPSLFTIAPDIYVPEIAQTMDEYTTEDNPLFVPEVRKDAQTASYCLYAFFAKNAIGYSPFGIEDLALPPESIARPPMEVMIALNIDPAAFDITDSKKYLSQTYGIVHTLTPQILKYRNMDRMHSWVRKTDSDRGVLLHLSDYDVQVAFSPKGTAQPLASGAIIELDNNRFLLVGMMSTLTFMPKPGERKQVDVVSYEEGSFIDGTWTKNRTLNGDEKMNFGFGPMPEIRMLELFKY